MYFLSILKNNLIKNYDDRSYSSNIKYIHNKKKMKKSKLSENIKKINAWERRVSKEQIELVKKIKQLEIIITKNIIVSIITIFMNTKQLQLLK